MKQNATKAMEALDDVNPVSKLWQRIGCNGLLHNHLFEYMCLAEIAIIVVLGSIEDERTFSNLAFIKNKVRNRLGGHLDTTVRMYSQGFYDLQLFPYHEPSIIGRGEGPGECACLNFLVSMNTVSFSVLDHVTL
jgi:hypothetical protein